MNKKDSFSIVSDEDKAGYNQSGKITDVLGNLRITFVSAMMRNDFKSGLEVIRCVLNIIAGKMKPEDIKGMNKEIYSIEDNLTKTEETFVWQGARYFKNPKLRKEVKKNIEDLYRDLEKMQDKYGYGMVSAEDPRLAILQR